MEEIIELRLFPVIAGQNVETRKLNKNKKRKEKDERDRTASAETVTYNYQV